LPRKAECQRKSLRLCSSPIGFANGITGSPTAKAIGSLVSELYALACSELLHPRNCWLQPSMTDCSLQRGTAVPLCC